MVAAHNGTAATPFLTDWKHNLPPNLMLKLELTFETLSKSLLSLLYWGNFINTKTSTSKSSINQLRLFHILLQPIICYNSAQKNRVNFYFRAWTLLIPAILVIKISYHQRKVLPKNFWKTFWPNSFFGFHFLLHLIILLLELWLNNHCQYDTPACQNKLVKISLILQAYKLTLWIWKNLTIAEQH